MNPLSLVWDVLFVDSAINDTKSAKIVAAAMEEVTDAPVKFVMNWNTVMKGQKTSAAGFTSGLRFVYDLNGMSAFDVKNLNNDIGSFSHELSALSKVSISESISFKLDRRTKTRFPSVGRLMLQVKFTHGLGYTDSKKIANAISTQTKETKEGLNPLELGKGGSGGRFSSEFRDLMSDPYWFRIFPTSGLEKKMLPLPEEPEEGWPLDDDEKPIKPEREFDYIPRKFRPSEISLNIASDGGLYELAFDLRQATKELTERSEGVWWEPLDPEQLTLTPRLLVDYGESIDSPYDPSNFHHYENKAAKLIEKALDTEQEQTGDASLVEDIDYTLNRLVRGRRNPRQLTEQHGLVSGIEASLVENEVILPWIAEEFVACLGFFLMTRKPKYWRNGASEIHLLHEFSDDLIESLIEV